MLALVSITCSYLCKKKQIIPFDCFQCDCFYKNKLVSLEAHIKRLQKHHKVDVRNPMHSLETLKQYLPTRGKKYREHFTSNCTKVT